jgi:hypothetical protein
MNKMSPNSDDNGRRSWGNEARDDFKFKHRHECVLRKSKKISDIDEKATLDFEVNDIRPPELFDNGKRIVAVGGYIKTDSPVKYEVRLLTNGNEVVAEGNTVSNKWEDIGAHIEIEDNSIPNDGYNVNANLSVESINSELNELQLYGINIEPVTFPYYVKNISYEGRTIGEVFNESVSKAYFPQQLYYLDHSEPLPIKPTDTADNNLEPGSVVVLIRCKRECGRLLPVEYEEEKSGRRFKISFSAHSRPDSGYCNHDQPWNKFPVSLDQSTVYPEDVPNGLDELIRKKESEQIELFDIDKKESHSPGFIFNSHFGFQAGCRACRKYEVNDELNSDRDGTVERVTDELFEYSK